MEDVDADLLVDEKHHRAHPRGEPSVTDCAVGEVSDPKPARLYATIPLDGLEGTVRFEWDALDTWFEEDEEMFVHPRNPYTRVDALRSTRRVRVELAGAVLAESAAPVMVFETGLPTRYYFNRTDVNFDYLVPSDTVTACPYKGRTSDYWSVAGR